MGGENSTTATGDYWITADNRQTLGRAVKAAGSRFDENQVWGIEVERPDDARQQVADAVALVHDRGAVAFLCAKRDTADRVIEPLSDSVD